MAKGYCSTCCVLLSVENSSLVYVQKGSGYCKKCKNARYKLYFRKRRKENPEQIRKVKKRYLKKYFKKLKGCPELRIEHNRKIWIANLRTLYGITQEEFDAKLIGQSGRCEICNQPLLRPCLDHNHDTKINRDILCLNCNGILGMAYESKEVLLSAVRYLEKHANNSSI
jgi:hypothetical protein